jgi:hypothetical protein
MKKIIIIGAVVLVAVVVIIFFVIHPTTGIFEGMVYDCTTNEPVADARVQIFQGCLSGWPDTGCHYEGQTDQVGKFSMKYGGGSGMVTVTKLDDGYLVTQSAFLGGKTRVGLMKQQSSGDMDYIVGICQRSSACTETKVVNGVTESRITCSSTLPQL